MPFKNKSSLIHFHELMKQSMKSYPNFDLQNFLYNTSLCEVLGICSGQVGAEKLT